jgi:serine/threonine-protein kinase
MAEVWHAQHRGPAGFTRDVCLKRVLPGASANGAAQLFLEEARLAARLQHPNIVQVLDFDEHDGTPYLVMELLQGETLAALTARTQRAGAPVSVRLAAGIVERCARGLGHAHRQSPPVVHRDFSPHNVFLTRDGLVKVLDFGIARALGAPLTTAVGMVRGRPAYMAPEQAAGHAVPASDVFSLGVVAYELLTGQRLYPAEFEPVAIFNKLLAERSAWPGPAERNPLVPPGLDALVRRMLERDAAARFTDGAQCAEALLAWLREARLELSEQELAAELSLRGPDGAYVRPSSPEAKTLVRGKPVSSPGAPAAAALPADARTVVGEAVVVVPRPSAPHGSGPVPSPVVVFPAPVAPGRKPPVDAGDDQFAEPPRTAATEVVPAVAPPLKTELLAAAALGTSQSPVLARGAAQIGRAHV